MNLDLQAICRYWTDERVGQVALDPDLIGDARPTYCQMSTRPNRMLSTNLLQDSKCHQEHFAGQCY